MNKVEKLNTLKNDVIEYIALLVWDNVLPKNLVTFLCMLVFHFVVVRHIPDNDSSQFLHQNL